MNSLISTLVIVFGYQYSVTIKNLVSWEKLGYQIVGIETNGALAIEQFKLYKPKLVIMDTIVPIIGIDPFLQLMRSIDDEFIAILLDDSNSFIPNNLSHVYTTLSRENLNERVLETTLLSLRKIFDINHSSDDTQTQTSHQILSECFADGTFDIKKLYELKKNHILNISPSLDLLLPRPDKSVEFNDSVFSGIQKILDNYNGGDTILMADGLLCVLINTLDSSDSDVERRYDQLFYEIRLFLINEYKCGFTFYLNNAVPLNRLSEKFSALKKAYELGYFLNELLFVKPHLVLQNKKTFETEIINDLYISLVKSLFSDQFGKSQDILHNLFFDFIKPSMEFDLLLENRFRLFKIFSVLASTMYQENLKSIESYGFASLEEEFEWFNQFLKNVEESLGQNETQLNPIVLDAMIYIICNYEKQLSLTTLASMVNVSPTYLSHLIKNSYGFGFSEFLLQVRIDRAKQYIVQTDYKVHEISQKIGIIDYRYFSSVFKKITGKTPTQFRESAMKNLENNK